MLVAAFACSGAWQALVQGASTLVRAVCLREQHVVVAEGVPVASVQSCTHLYTSGVFGGKMGRSPLLTTSCGSCLRLRSW